MRKGLVTLVLAGWFALGTGGCKNWEDPFDPFGFGISNGNNTTTSSVPDYEIATTPQEKYTSIYPEEQLLYYIDYTSFLGEVKVGEPVTFNAYPLASPSESTLKLEWTFPDGSTSDGNSATKTFNKEGENSVKLTVENPYFTGGRYEKEFVKEVDVKPN